MKNSLGVFVGDQSGKYLRLPSLVGRRKREILGFIKDKIVGHIQSWNSKYLSRAGKEVMLKNVLKAIPTYAMSGFLLPVDLSGNIESTLNGYWWGCEKRGRKGIRWKEWKYLCIPNKGGGMGFRNIRNFNLAILSK